MIAPERLSVSVACVVVDQLRRALILKRRDTGDWQPPGGILEFGEPIHAGLRREVYEETGLVVEPERLTGVYQNMSRGVIALVFHCRRTGGSLTRNDEATHFRWVTADEARALMTEAFSIRVLDALDARESPPIRTHDGLNLL